MWLPASDEDDGAVDRCSERTPDRRILVVGETLTAFVLARLLENRGFEVTTAPSDRQDDSREPPSEAVVSRRQSSVPERLASNELAVRVVFGDDTTAYYDLVVVTNRRTEPAGHRRRVLTVGTVARSSPDDTVRVLADVALLAALLEHCGSVPEALDQFDRMRTGAGH